MDISLQTLSDSLRHVSEQYHSIISNARFDYNNWSENVKLLSPIVLQLKKQSESRIALCEEEITLNNNKQVVAFDNRSALYSKLESEKTKLSQIDLERIRIIKEIALLSQEISDDKNKIAKLQNKIAEIKKENEYWDTVFWSTCWIPFVNIGTGIKKHVEDGQYYAAAKVLVKEIVNKQSRISNLNNHLQTVTSQQAINHESSGKLANQITAVEGEIAAVTSLINDLREGMKLWQAILSACSEINVKLQHANGKIEAVLESFERLMKVEELLISPTTDKYINGCLCKGNILSVGQRLNKNEYLISRNNRFVAVMQSDNNFVVYNSENPIWESKTYGAQGNGYVELNTDGLVSLKGINRDWNTKRNGAIGLILQDDGNLITYDKNNKPLWATDTYTYANVPGICFNKH